MRSEPQVRDGQGSVQPAHLHENATRSRSFMKRMRFVMLIVALTAVVAVTAGAAGETNAFAVPMPGVDDVPQSASALPPRSSHSARCALKYAAVLDLAELARRDGKSSSAYQHAFSNVAGQMSDCDNGARYAGSPSAVVKAATGAASAAYE